MTCVRSTPHADLERAGDVDDFGKMLHAVETEAADVNAPAEERFLPASLQEVMRARGCRWNALFRFAVRLRSAKGGCDTQWIANARHARRASRNLNWYQCLGMLWCSRGL